MHEFQRRRQLGVILQLFLDEVLHRLDVMVGGALDLLHARGLGRAEAGGQVAQAGDGGVGERRQFDDARFGGQRQQPFHLDRDAGLDQAVFGEDRAQRVDLAGIAAIERGQGEQGGIGHVGRAGTSGGADILRRAGGACPVEPSLRSAASENPAPCGKPSMGSALQHGPADGTFWPVLVIPRCGQGSIVGAAASPGSDTLPAAASLSPTEVVRS